MTTPADASTPLSQSHGSSAAHSDTPTLTPAGPQSGLRASDLEASATPGELRTSAIAPDHSGTGGRYVLTAFHARGGMGEVWRCQDASLGREVALKRLISDRPGARQRFLVEAQITGQLEHPGIVPIHDTGIDDSGKPYYVMKLVRGRTLKAAIDEFHRLGSFAVDTGPGESREVHRLRLLKVFLDICNAVAYAHSRGIIHRDLKPENVMLGPYGETLLLDWGVAKLKGQPELPGEAASLPPMLSGGTAHTEDGSILGSPLYMPPEMAEGHTTDADQRTDVYLLGATLYEVLTGRPPRHGASRDEILELARTAPPVPPRQLARDSPRALEAICLKAMSRDRDARYRTATELADDVQRFVAGEPVSACPDPAWRKAWRWCMRHRRALGRAAVAALVLTIALAGAAIYRDAANVRAREHARVQIEEFRRASDQARFYAASVDDPGERAPYFDPARGEKLAQQALDVVQPWGDRLEGLPLADRRDALRREMADLCLLLAQSRLNKIGDDAPTTDVLPLLDRADTLLDGPTLASRRLRADSLRKDGRVGDALREQQLADDPSARRTARDLFLEAESERRSAKGLARKQRSANLTRAIAVYRSALRDDPTHYWAHLQVGYCYVALGRAGEAVEALGACVALRPDAPWGYTARALPLAVLRRFDEATADLDRALSLDPNSLPAQINRGALLMLQERYAEAETHFAALVASGDPPPEALYYRGQLFLRSGDNAGALECFDALVRARPAFALAWTLRARAHLLMGQDERALRDLDSVVALTPDSAGGDFSPSSAPIVRARRGRLLRELAAQLPGANRQRALRLAFVDLTAATADPGTAPPAAFADLGAVLDLQGQPDAAVSVYDHAIARTPGDVQILINRAWALNALQRLDDAAADFSRALQLSSDHPEAMVGLGYVRARQGRGAEAQRQASIALLHAAGDYLVLHNVACIYAVLSVTDPSRRAGHQDTAMEVLRRAVEACLGSDEVELARREVAFPRSMREREDFKQLIERGPHTSGRGGGASGDGKATRTDGPPT